VKKIIVLLFASVSAFTAFSQEAPNYDLDKEKDLYRNEIELIPFMKNQIALDTLFPVSLLINGCDSVIALYTFSGPNGGYVCGTNGLGHKEKAELYDLFGTADLYAILVIFAAKQNNMNSQISGKVYSSNAGAPGTLLGTTEIVDLADIDTTGEYTAFNFTTPIPLTSAFFTGFDVANATANGDSLGCYSTIQGCFTNVQRAWEKRANDSWMPFNDGTNQTWGLNVDMLIFPVIEMTSSTGIDNDYYIANRDLQLYGNFPNPADEHTMVKYAITSESNVNIDIYSESGQLLKHQKLGTKTGGSHFYMLDTKELPAGNYFYSVNTSEATLFSRLVVSR